MTRDDLAKKLKVIFGHDIKIEVGDKERQTRDWRPNGNTQAARRLEEVGPWSSSPLYDEILGAVEDFGREIGGVPNIGHIVFYDVRYDYDEQLKVVADRKVAAQINRTKGIMFVYRAALFETQVVEGGRGSRAPACICPPAQHPGEAGDKRADRRRHPSREPAAHDCP